MLRNWVMPNRVMIFIDGSNVYHSIRDLHHRTDIDYAKLANCLAEGRDLQRTYFYNAMVDQTVDPKGYQDQQRFIAALKTLPYFELRLGYLIYRGTPPRPLEKGVDVRLAVDMLTRAYGDQFDVAVLVSADNDFAHLVQAVKDRGKHVEVALFDQRASSSRQLREAADRVIGIDAAYLGNCWR